MLLLLLLRVSTCMLPLKLHLLQCSTCPLLMCPRWHLPLHLRLHLRLVVLLRLPLLIGVELQQLRPPVSEGPRLP